MKKRLLIIGLGLVGSFSILFTRDEFLHSLKADSMTLNAVGGTITGRVHIAPDNLSGNKSAIGFKSGDKIAVQAGNNDNAWQLDTETTIDTYNCNVTLHQPTKPTVCKNSPIQAWASLMTKPIAQNVVLTTQTNTTLSPWIRITENSSYYGFNTSKDYYNSAYIPYHETLPAKSVEQLNTELSKTTDKELLTYYNEKYFFDYLNSNEHQNNKIAQTLTNFTPSKFGKKAYIYGISEQNIFTTNQKKFASRYWMSYNRRIPEGNVAGWGNELTIAGTNGIISFIRSEAKPEVAGNYIPTTDWFNEKADVRPAANLDLNNVVFAVSKSSSSDSGLATITSVPNDFSKTASNYINDAQSYGNMIARIYDSTMSITLQDDPFYLKTKDQALAKVNDVQAITKGQSIRIKANGSVGGTISAVIFDTEGKPLYYTTLGASTGTDAFYELDSTNLKVGSYQIAIVNEELPADGDVSPVHSSKFSSAYTLSVVDPITIEVNAKTDLEHSKNVNTNDVVASISSSGGVTPITYSIVSETSVSGHIDDFKKFDITGTDIFVKDTNGLEAGEYYFKVLGVDANGHPIDGVSSQIIHITVAKTNPDLKFDLDAVDLIVDGQAVNATFSHKNRDVLDSDFQLTFSSNMKTIADVDEATGNSDTDVKITPSSLNGSATIKVELAETKNFAAAEATLIVHVHPKISLTFTAAKNSFAVTDVAASDTKIGSVSLTGNSPQYEYSMEMDPANPDHGANNDLFQVETQDKTMATSMDILTATPNLPQGVYKFSIKVKDMYGQTAYASGTIIVSGIAQTDFDFYDYKNTSTKLTDKTLTIYYGEKNAFLVANGGQTSGLTYETVQPNDRMIEVDPKDGNIKIKEIGTTKVKATKPADGTYSEAVIYMDVEVKPCEQSIAFTDPTDPLDVSFDAANPTIQQDAQGLIKSGMPNEGDAGHGAITYRVSDTNLASVDADGTLTLQDPAGMMKSFTLTATINDTGNGHDAHYTTESITKTIRVYPKGSASWKQNSQPQADDTKVPDKVGKVSVSGGTGTPNFSISPKTTKDNIDFSFFDIDSAGNVTIKQPITHDDLIGKNINVAKHAYEMKIEVEIVNGGTMITLPVVIYIKGATRTGLAFDDKDPITMEITKTYKEAPDNTFELGLNQVITGTTITYRLASDADNPTDVINVLRDGTTEILHANEGGSYQPVKVEANIPMCNGYEETIVSGLVRIKKAKQELSFSSDPINTDISVSALNIAIAGHKDSYDLSYSSSDTDIDVDADLNDSDQMIIRPNNKAVNGVSIRVTALGDRDYNSAMKEATLNIDATVAQHFNVVFPKMTYGDTDAKHVTMIPNDPNSTYRYTVEDTRILEIDDSGNITIHHAGDTSVQVSKIDASGTLGPYSFHVSVKPRPVTVTIDHKEKYVGMELPEFTSQLTSGSLVAKDTLGTVTYKCLSDDHTPVNKDTDVGTYTISGAYTIPNNDYKITVMDGELTIKQDAGEPAWYHLEDHEGKPTTSDIWHKNSVDVVVQPGSSSSAGVYDQISSDQQFTNTDTTRFTVSDEGEILQDIYFRIDPNGNDPHKGAITSPVQETIRIDKTDPIIKSITGRNEPNSKVRGLLHAITFGKFFKQGTIITIEAEDVSPSQGVAVSGIQKTSYEIKKLDEHGDIEGTPNTIDQNDDTIEISIKEAGTYEVCATATDQAGRESEEKCKTFDIRKIDADIDKDGNPDFNDPDGNGCADFNIVYKDEETGDWKTLNVDADRDGIPEMDIDSDGDGLPDMNVDTDKDGKPDVNLILMTKQMWKPTTCVTQHNEQYASGVDITPQINVDLDFKTTTDSGKAIPDINIDTDGDMKPNLNITKENSTTPYLNILPMKRWQPKSDYTVQDFTYDTMDWVMPLTNYDSDHDGYPDLNIDFNLDGMPDINIDDNYDGLPDLNVDTDGDGVPNYNLDVDENGKPTKNIYPFTEWKPEKNGEKDSVLFDTMEIIGKSELEDNGIVIEKPDGNFLPNYAIKVQEVTESKKEEVTEQASDLIEDEQEVKAVYDVKLLENDVEVQPDGTLKVKIPIPEGVTNPKLLIKKKNGKHEIVSAKVENGYLLYETDELGTVSVIGDMDKPSVEPKPDTPQDDPSSDEPTNDTSKTSVQGSYTSTSQVGAGLGANMGGAFTGDDDHHSMLYIGTGILSFSSLIWMLYCKKGNRKKHEE